MIGEEQGNRLSFSGNAPYLFPTEIVHGVVSYNKDDKRNIKKKYPFQSEWGYALPINNTFDRIVGCLLIEIAWISAVEEKTYFYKKNICTENFIPSSDKIKQADSINKLFIVGMAPYGGIAFWLSNPQKSVLIEWGKAEVSKRKYSEFISAYETISLHEICKRYISDDRFIRKNLQANGLPPHDLFDNYMKQFTYRYQVMYEYWSDDKEKWQKYYGEEIIAVCDYIEEALFDGTHDKLHDGGLMNYHQAGKPKKLAVKWHIKKSEYTAYFWFEDEAIRNVFDRFYGAHPETKTDFMIRIDTEKNKYELALYRYGLKEPQVISESAYQLLVFKNKFEYYRSENYNQPRGAWIW